MALLKESDPRFVGIERKVGLFIFLAVAGIIAVVVFIGVQQEVFTPKAEIFFVAPGGQGINEGASVKLSGFVIGSVKKLSLDDVARVTVKLSINKKYMKWIKTDSTAKLVSEGLIGAGIIEISPGSPSAPELKDKGFLPFTRDKGIAGMAEELKDVIKPALFDIKNIIAFAANDPEGGIKVTLRNVSRLTGDLSTTRYKVDELIKDIDKAVLGISPRVANVLDTTNSAMGKVDVMVKKIDNDVGVSMKKVQGSLDKLDKSLENVRAGTEKVPSVLQNTDAVAQGTKEIVDSIKKIWPISSNIEKPKEKPLKVDSYE